MLFKNLSVDRHGSVFVITMQKPPENRINTAFAQELIRAFRYAEKELGHNSDGAVITRGSDEKFWCTVGGLQELIGVKLKISRELSLTKRTQIPMLVVMGFIL
jgi:enoyl-CoA hydratase/carnithine racemase